MQEAKSRKVIIKLLPLVILLLALGAFFYFGLHRYLTLTALKSHREFLVGWTDQHYLMSVVIFMALYALMVAISAPNATLLTIIGGFLFGPIFGTIYVVVSATIGAVVIFIAAKTALYDFFAGKAKPWLKKFTVGFQKNALSYLLFLRLVPLFPFWVINIVPGILGVRLRTYIIATFFGIIPGTFTFVLLGNGLGVILDQGKALDMTIIYRPSVFIPLIFLGVLSLIPIVYKHIQSKRSEQ